MRVLALAVNFSIVTSALASSPQDPMPMAAQLDQMTADIMLNDLGTLSGEQSEWCGKPQQKPTSCEIAIKALISAAMAQMEQLQTIKVTLGSSPEDVKRTAAMMKAYRTSAQANAEFRALVEAKFKPPHSSNL